MITVLVLVLVILIAALFYLAVAITKLISLYIEYNFDEFKEEDESN